MKSAVVMCHHILYYFLQPASPLNGERSPRENGPDKGLKKEGVSSPRSDGSSHASTPSSKHKEVGISMIF